MTRQRDLGGSAHLDHDRFLVAAFAADDLTERTRQDAEALVASCAGCAALLADIRAIAAASRELAGSLSPLPVGRQFTLSRTDAETLGRRPWWTRLLRPFGTQGAAQLRPAAGAMAALGLVGLLLGMIPGTPLLASPSAGGAPQAQQATAFPATAGPALVYDTNSGVFGPLETGGKRASATAVPTDRDVSTYTGAEKSGGILTASTPTRGPSPLTVLSAGLLMVGIAFLALRAAARRLT